MIQPGGFQRQIDAERAMSPAERKTLAREKIHVAIRRQAVAEVMRDYHGHSDPRTCKYEQERIMWGKHLAALDVYLRSIRL